MSLRSALFSSLSACLLLCGTAVLPAAEPSWAVKPGPWGELFVRAVYLEPPDNLLAIISKPTSVTRWTFDQMTEGSVRELLARTGVPADVISRLCAPSQMIASGNSVVLLPKLQDLLDLPTAVRSALYAELAKSPSNEYQRDPVYILGGDIDDWLSECDMGKPQQELMRKLLWKRGEATAFSDIQVLISQSGGPDEVSSILRTMTRVRSLIIELKLPLSGGRQAFMDYWGAGSLNAERAPFLSAITRRRAPQLIDATQFLPVLARRRIYTFPNSSLGLKGRMPDCHWTSLNFFEEEPRDLYLDSEEASKHLLSGYVAVDAPYQFGDVLCFLDGGQGLHTCVHIVDDIVLTKNGESVLAPWTLMQRKDVDSIYRQSASTRIQGYRLRK